MELGQDTRGVSEVIGAILMFGLIIMLLAILQTQAVPAANEDVEFSHSNLVQGQFVDAHQAFAETARTGDADSTKLDMGVNYPARMMFFNPPPPSGQLHTSDAGTVRIENVQAEDQTVAKYISSGSITVSSRSLIYEPHYNEYRQAPSTRYEYGVLYNQHPDTQLLVNDGGVIQGRQISLLMPAGELHESSSKAISIDPRPVSAPANTVTITGDGNGPITLTLPSSMDKSLWEDAVNSNYVVDIRETGDGNVTIELEPGQTYSLRMARIGVGSDTPAQQPTYLHSPSGTQLDIPQGQSRVIDVEVRDKYNNPVPNQQVKLQAADGSVKSPVNSSGDGMAKVRYSAPPDPTRTTINATLDEDFTDFDPTNDPRDFSFDVWVTRFAGGFGSDPDITQFDIASTACVDDDGNIIDDPVAGISSADAYIEVDWEVQHQDDETNMDTVDIRIIRQNDNRVGDTALYAYDEDTHGSTQTVGGTADLVDEGQCGTTYDVRILAETTGNARVIDSKEDITAE